MSTLDPTARALATHTRRSRLLRWLAHLGPLGLFAVATVDSSIIPLPLPGSTDLLLLWLVSRGGNFWLLVTGAVAGSVVGGYFTWHIGRRGGHAALRRYVPARLLDPVCGWVMDHPILAVFLPALLPPPMPLTSFVLSSGALGVGRRRFLIAFGTARSLRYTLIAWLGAAYGRHVVRLWSEALQKWSAPLLWTFVVLLIAGIGFGIRRTLAKNRSSTPKDESAAAAAFRVG
jgi:membrane protein YqaA with SNARE-associated domain